MGDLSGVFDRHVFGTKGNEVRRRHKFKKMFFLCSFPSHSFEGDQYRPASRDATRRLRERFIYLASRRTFLYYRERDAIHGVLLDGNKLTGMDIQLPKGVAAARVWYDTIVYRIRAANSGIIACCKSTPNHIFT